MPATPSPYHRLNPLTKAVIATVGSIGAFVLGGYVGPIAIMARDARCSPGAPASWRSLARVSLLLTLPIAISVVLVSVFTRAGHDGPLPDRAVRRDRRRRRLRAPDPRPPLRDLAVDRAVHHDHRTRARSSSTSSGAACRRASRSSRWPRSRPCRRSSSGPAMIGESQRARGLDTEGSFRARVRGLLPIVGPVIIGSLTDVEERSLALESRAFSRPGRRHLLWAMPDETLGAGAALGPRRCCSSPPRSRASPAGSDGAMLASRGVSYRYAGYAKPGPPRHRPDARRRRDRRGRRCQRVRQVDAVPRGLGPGAGLDRRRADRRRAVDRRRGDGRTSRSTSSRPGSGSGSRTRRPSCPA